MLLCESLVLSKLNYCINVYSGCIKRSTQHLIQRVQNACARYCFNIPPRAHVTPYLNKFGVLKMEGRQKLFMASLLFDVVHFGVPTYLSEKLTWSRAVLLNKTRATSHVLSVPEHRTAAFRGSFRYRASKGWNDIPPPIREAIPKFKFKYKLKDFLISVQRDQSTYIYPTL